MSTLQTPAAADAVVLPPLPGADWVGFDPEKGDLFGHSNDTLQSYARIAVSEALAAREKFREAEVRAKVVAELRSSAFLHCDVNKEDVLLCIKHGCTLIEARQREASGQQAPQPQPPVAVDAQALTRFGGMPFGEARANILGMDADAARGLAISLLIQLNIADKYSASPAMEVKS